MHCWVGCNSRCASHQMQWCSAISAVSPEHGTPCCVTGTWPRGSLVFLTLRYDRMVVRLAVQSLSHSSGSTWCSSGVPSNLKPPASNLDSSTCTPQADISFDMHAHRHCIACRFFNSSVAKTFLHIEHALRLALLMMNIAGGLTMQQCPSNLLQRTQCLEAPPRLPGMPSSPASNKVSKAHSQAQREPSALPQPEEQILQAEVARPFSNCPRFHAPLCHVGSHHCRAGMGVSRGRRHMGEAP